MNFNLNIVLGRSHKCLYYKIISNFFSGYLRPTYNMERCYQFQITEVYPIYPGHLSLLIIGFIYSS